MNNLTEWHRLEFEDTPIYVNPEKPDWVVPDSTADLLLKKGLEQRSPESREEIFHLHRLTSQLGPPVEDHYTGRAGHLKLGSLKECWFHLTDRCNLSCRHCLFNSSPGSRETLDQSVLKQAVYEAGELGCRLFYFTGGEPFVYSGFIKIITDILQDPASHVVILTNGLLLDRFIPELASLPSGRLHLQVSLDGLEKEHDYLRGRGCFQQVMAALDLLRDRNMPTTISMALNRDNMESLTDLVDLASTRKISNLHLMYHFIRGKGSGEQFVSPAEIFRKLSRAHKRGAELGVSIDNIEIIRSQVFSVPGSRHDLSNAGWQSLAIGPSGDIYPSPALIGMEESNCGSAKEGLEHVWRNSTVLQNLRESSLRGSDYEKNPLKFLVGGGDIDHSLINGGNFTGYDPYVELYNSIALYLIKNQVEKYQYRNNRPEYLLKMGDVRTDCPEGGKVSLTHCNCVISLADKGGRNTVREFYAGAAVTANSEIVNPFAGQQTEADYIPAASRERSYGCGSPVQDADLSPGEVLVDLGSGSGTECFQGAAEVGPQGRVIGIDMTREMLALADESRQQVAEKIGYHNVEFRFGYLEDLPLQDNRADVIISNCVINLSPDKRMTLQEAFRVLKPGGRLVVSDIVTERQVPVEIKNDQKLLGECLGGAFTQEDLLGILSAAGFTAVKFIKRFPYRKIEETQFFSLTFSARKPALAKEIEVIYRGPYGAVMTEKGQTLLKGKPASVMADDPACLDESVFIIDSRGTVANLDQGESCCSITSINEASSCCSNSPEGQNQCCSADSTGSQTGIDCLICGRPLVYSRNETTMICHNCGKECQSRVCCENGHYICDDCHQGPALAVIRKICMKTEETDMIRLLDHIRRQPGINLHGPEHHAMVPGIMVTTYLNRGGWISRDDIPKAVRQGSKVPGGACGFWGMCGAAAGAGIGFSLLLQASPLKGRTRQQAMTACSRILSRISEIAAPRCCQRETWLVLKEAARLSEELLPVPLLARAPLNCSQHEVNRECIRRQCPLWDSRSRKTGGNNILPLAGLKKVR